MAQSWVQLPADAAGKALATDTWTVTGAPNTNTVHGQNVVLYGPDGTPIARNATGPLGGTESGLVTRSFVQGMPQTTATGSITSATSAVTANLPSAGNVTIIVAGTYAGVTLNFEGSYDNTNYFPMAAVREENNVSEQTTGVLPANTIRAWTCSLPGINYFRVRASSWTSGTAAIVLDPGTWPFQPEVAATVSPPANRYPVRLSASAVAGTGAIALTSLTPYVSTTVGAPGITAGAAVTTYAPTTGRTFRITSVTINLYNSTTTTNGGIFELRVNNAAVATSSPWLWMTGLGAGVAAANAGASDHWYPQPGEADIPSGYQVGITQTTATTGRVNAVIVGYEF